MFAKQLLGTTRHSNLCIYNKFARSNLRRGPRRGSVAYLRRKIPMVTMARPKIRPQKYPFCGPIPNPHYLPDPWTRPTYDAKRHRDPICRVSTTDRPTDARTDRQTDRSSTRKFDDYRPLRYESDVAQ